MDTTKPIERDDVSMVLQTLGAGGDTEFSKRGWDKVLLENTDDVLHVLSLKGLFLYLSRASKKVLEYDPQELVGTALSSVCHPSDIVPVTRELKDTAPGSTVDIVFRIRRKHSGYTWFESHGSLHTEQGKGKKCIILVGRERPVYALERRNLVSATEIGENELWSKMSTSGMYLFVSSHARSLLDRQPDELRGTSAQNLMRPDSKQEFNKMLELARSGVKATFKHDIQNKRGQTLHAQTTLYPGDAVEGQKPTFLVAQTKLLKMSRAPPPLLKHHSEDSQVSHGAVSTESGASKQLSGNGTPYSITRSSSTQNQHLVTSAGGHALPIGNQDQTLASDDNVFDELKTTRSTSWQFELRQMEKRNRVLAEEVQSLNSSKKKRKRRKGMGQLQKDCANCHTRSTPEWRRGPSGNRDLCNSCGLRWAKAVCCFLSSYIFTHFHLRSLYHNHTIYTSLIIYYTYYIYVTTNPIFFETIQNGRVSPRTNSHSDKNSNSPLSMSPADTKYQGGKDLLKSPKKTNLDSHNFKTARMEAMSSPGFAGGIPAKIEEVAEPPE